MRKNIISISDGSRFSWLQDPDFVPPGTKNGACVTYELSARKIGELKTLLKYFLENIIHTSNANAGVVRLLSPDGRTLQLISSAGKTTRLQRDAEQFETLNCELSHNTRLGNDVHLSDISHCQLREGCFQGDCNFKSLIGAPLNLMQANGKPLGYLTVFFDTTSEFSIQSKALIETFAKMMSATIEHSQINREEKRMELLTERNAIASDIHDSLAQTLIYARMRASLLLDAIRQGNIIKSTGYADDLDDALATAQKSARELVTSFRCEMNRGGLFVALRELVDAFRKRNNIVLDYHNRLINQDIPLEFEIQVYHIVQECLNNIARHSGATHARLFIEANLGYHVFTIEDNGVGTSTFSARDGHYGMKIMRERALKIGGTLKFDSRAGQGTHVQLFFPEPVMDWRAVS
jgi:two-component system nitrate/nitrite sensor histidine kinase NarX